MTDSSQEHEQPTIEDYINNPPLGNKHIKDVDDGWRCVVCSYEAEEAEEVTVCHPPDRLDQERKKSVSSPDDAHTGFNYPPQLFAEIRKFFKQVENAIRPIKSTDSALQAATDVIKSQLSPEFPASKAFQLYSYLVFCQQHQLLPGYPQYTNTSNDTIPLQRFCSEHPRFTGDVTDDAIAESTLIRTEQVYRAKVRTTSRAFLSQESVFPMSGNVPWQYQTVWDADEPVDVMGVVGEGTAHNVLAVETRDWLSYHPEIDWAVAPHMMGDRTDLLSQRQHSPKFSTETATNAPEHPVSIYDAAGFSDDQPPRLTALCIVVDNDSLKRTTQEVAIASRCRTRAYGIVVLPDRESIVNLIAYADSKGAFPHDPSPDRDIKTHYSRLPSISAINTELSNQAFDQPWILFLTRKQLVDGLIDPDELFSLAQPTADE